MTLVSDIRQQLTARLKELEPLVQEYRETEAALQSLGQNGTRATPRRRATATARKPASRRPGAKRAPRGQNRAAIMGLIGERPGVSAAQIASSTKIGKATVATFLSKAKKAGEVQSDPQVKGGYRLL